MAGEKKITGGNFFDLERSRKKQLIWRIWRKKKIGWRRASHIQKHFPALSIRRVPVFLINFYLIDIFF